MSDRKQYEREREREKWEAGRVGNEKAMRKK